MSKRLATSGLKERLDERMWFKNNFSSQILVLLFISLTIHRSAFSIIGGEFAKCGQFPSTVFILPTICTGVKVGTHEFLSASHCGDITAGTRVQIEWKLNATLYPSSQEPQTANLTVTEVSQPPAFGTLIAFRVKEVTSDVAIAPIENDEPKVGDKYYMNGYGCIDPAGRKHPYLPQYFPFVQNYAEKVLAQYDRIHINLPDAIGEEPRASICFVDSGGPLYHLRNDGTLTLSAIAQFVSISSEGREVSSFERLDSGVEAIPPHPSVNDWIRKFVDGASSR